MKRLKLISLVFFILLGAFGLLMVTYTAFPSAEKPVREVCLIEDCAVGTRQAGFPFRSVELTRINGLNCSSDRTSNLQQCNDTTTNVPALLLNYLFYVALLSGIAFVLYKLLKHK